MNSTNKLLLQFLCILLCIGFFSSCKEIYDMETFSEEIYLSPGYLGPVVYGNLSLNDLVEKYDTNEYIIEDDDMLLHFIYSDSLISKPASDIVSIPIQNFLQIYIDSEIGIPAFILSQIGDTINFHKVKNYEFALENNGKLDSVLLKEGDLNLSVYSEFRHYGILTITSDYIKKGGENFRKVVQISSADGNFSWNESIDLTDYHVMLDNTNPDTSFLPIYFDLQLINSGAGINPGETCEITMAFDDLDFKAAFGFIGDYELLLDSGKVENAIFKEHPDWDISFEDPQFTVEIENSYGIPIQVELQNFWAYSSEYDQRIDIVFDPSINPFVIQAPSLSEVGETKTTEIVISRNTSNILDAIDIKPDIINYGVNATTNPSGTVERNHFILDTSKVNVNYEVKIPLWFSASGLSLEEDSLEFDYEDNFGDFSDHIESLSITMEVDNWLPFDIGLQVYFMDISYQAIDSLFDMPERVLASDPAKLDAEGKVLEPEKKITEILFTPDKLEKIEPAKYIMVKATLATTGNGQTPVKIFSYYTIGFKLGFRVNFEFDSRE